jgi:electron transport complex protein RnfG
MKDIAKYGVILAVICLVASSILAGMYSFAKPHTDKQAQAGTEAGLLQVIPQASRFEAVKSKDEILYYQGYDKENKPVGIAFYASAKGYSSTIETLAGMSEEGKIIAIKVINQDETPGLGTRVDEKSFTEQFCDRGVTDLLQVSTISGATISSSAVIKSVKQRAEEIQRLLKK